jgi:hypothetical protein
VSACGAGSRWPESRCLRHAWSHSQCQPVLGSACTPHTSTHSMAISQWCTGHSAHVLQTRSAHSQALLHTRDAADCTTHELTACTTHAPRPSQHGRTPQQQTTPHIPPPWAGHLEHLLVLDSRHTGRLALRAAQRLVDHDARVGERVALALRACARRSRRVAMQARKPACSTDDLCSQSCAAPNASCLRSWRLQ